jgi:hypothetical protein
MTTQTDVAQLYTAFFDRAPDAAGLAYWVNELQTGLITLEQMASNWVNEQPEGQAKYPNGTSDTAFLDAIYQNVLGRSPDAEGQQYWLNQLSSGAMSRDVFIAAIINGAHANTSAQGVLDAKLLDNKAAVGVAFADHGTNNLTLAAKILTPVTASDASLNSSLSLIKLIPSGAALTPALISKLSLTIDKVAALIEGQPGEQADLATYLSTVSAGITSNTNIDLLLTKIGTVATSALTDSTALDNPATLGQDDLASATPGGGGDGGDPGTPGPTLTATSADGLLKIVGTSTAEVHVDMTTHVVTSGTTTVTVSGPLTFTGVDASTYTGAVTAVGTVKQIVANNPVYTGVDRLEVVDKASTILNWAEYYLNGVVQKITVLNGEAGTLTVAGHDELTGLTAGQTWTYDIRDTVSVINDASHAAVLTGAGNVTVADTLANLSSPEGTTAIDGHQYIVRDTYDHLVAGAADPVLLGAVQTIVHDTVEGVQTALAASAIPAGAEYEVQDTAEHLLAADPDFLLQGPSSVTVTDDNAGVLTLEQRDALGKVTDDDFWDYTINDSAANILDGVGEHADYLAHANDVTVTGDLSLSQLGTLDAGKNVDVSGWHYTLSDSADNVVASVADHAAYLAQASDVTVTGPLSLSQLGTIDDAQGVDVSGWHYTLSDTAANMVDSLTDHVAYLTQASDVTITGNINLGQLDAAAVVPGIDVTAWHFSLVDSVSNINAHFAIDDIPITATTSADADALDGNISEGAVTMSFAGLTDAATFTFADSGFSSTEPVDTFVNFAATDKINLQAFQLTGEDNVTLADGGVNGVTDGHYALLKGVALVDGKYVASTAPEAGTLVIWDADTTAGAIKQVGMFVADANLDVSHLVTTPVVA